MNSSRNKILLFLVGILLVTNVVVLGFFLKKNEQPDKGQRAQRGGDRSAIMRAYLKDSVGFNEQQLAQFDQIRQQHRETMKPLFEEMKQAKLSFYNLLKQSGAADSASLAAAETMAQKQKAVDLAFFRHFQEIRSLCTPQQQPAYDSLVQQIVRRMIGGQPRKGDPKQYKEGTAKHNQ
jgi:periplasmic protein CpxP/Spy